MQMNAISRKSAVVAIALLVAILSAAVLRYWFAPFNMELADNPTHDKVWLVVIAVLLYFGNAFLQGKMLMRAGLSASQNTLPLPVYGLLACGVFVAPDMIETSVASLCFAFSLYLLLRSLHNLEETDSVFFASILLGAMVLFYPPCVILALVIPIAIFALGLSLRQSLLMIVGYVIPFFATSYVVWYRGGAFFDVGSKICSGIATSQMAAIEQVPYVAISFVALVAVLLIWGVVHAAIRPVKILMLMRVRRALYFFLFVALAAMAILLMPACDLSACAIIAVPLTILLCFVLDVLPGGLSTIAYWVLLVLFVVHLFVA